MNKNCDHCKLPIVELISSRSGSFCCHGCSVAYDLIKNCQIQLINNVTPQSKDFSYLDSIPTKKRLCIDKNLRVMRFYVEGIQCATCLWLLETLPQWLPQVKNSRLVMGKDTLTVEISDEGSFADVAKFLWAIGYKVHPLELESDVELHQREEQKGLLLRFGVAAFSFGNIMLLAIAVYSGLPKSYELTFNWISLFLFMPVLLYSAKPFFVSARRGLLLKKINIDVPIVLALVMGTLLSVYHLWLKIDDVYFDSLTALVCLLLGSRVFLKSIQRRFLTSNHLNSFIVEQSLMVKKQGQNHFVSVWPTEIEPGDLISLKKDQILPVEAQVLQSKAKFNTSLITGESLPRTLTIDEIALSGFKTTDNEVLLKAHCGWHQSGINSMLQSIELGIAGKSEYFKKVDARSKNFTLILLTISILFLIFMGSHNWIESTQRVLAFIIVACPCALAFAAPLVESLSLMLATEKGMLIKSPEVFEKLKNIKNIFIDKTGTLTTGHIQFEGWSLHEPSHEDLEVLFFMEQGSNHPIARAFVVYYENTKMQEKQIHPIEEAGVGVRAQYKGGEYFLGRLTLEDQKQHHVTAKAIGFYKNNQLISIAHFSEELNPGALVIIKYLKSKKLNITMLTGDNEAQAQRIAEELNINYVANMLPQEKYKVISSSNQSLMIGDGFNDVQAIAAADIGISVQGCMESCLKVSDVYLFNKGLGSVVDLYEISNKYLNGLKKVLLTSTTYNLLGGSLALMGFISPLRAAVFMPFSSLSVMLIAVFCIYGNQLIRSLKKIFKMKAVNSISKNAWESA